MAWVFDAFFAWVWVFPWVLSFLEFEFLQKCPISKPDLMRPDVFWKEHYGVNIDLTALRLVKTERWYQGRPCCVDVRSHGCTSKIFKKYIFACACLKHWDLSVVQNIFLKILLKNSGYVKASIFTSTPKFESQQW